MTEFLNKNSNYKYTQVSVIQKSTNQYHPYNIKKSYPFSQQLK